MDIDVVGVQILQRAMTRLDDLVVAQVIGEYSLVKRTRCSRTPPDSRADDALAVAVPVLLGGVEGVYDRIERSAQGSGRLLVVYSNPVLGSGLPRAHDDWRDIQSVGSQRSSLHIVSSPQCRGHPTPRE